MAGTELGSIGDMQLNKIENGFIYFLEEFENLAGKTDIYTNDCIKMGR